MRVQMSVISTVNDVSSFERDVYHFVDAIVNTSGWGLMEERPLFIWVCDRICLFLLVFTVSFSCNSIVLETRVISICAVIYDIW